MIIHYHNFVILPQDLPNWVSKLSQPNLHLVEHEEEIHVPTKIYKVKYYGLILYS